MQLTVGGGSAVLPGRETGTTQGMYWAWSDASEVIAWPAAGGSNRMDSLILRVADPQYGTITGNGRAYWDPVAGSGASARPDSDFLSGGAKYQPGAWLRVYDILVPAGATQLTQGNVAFKAGYATTLGFTPSFSTAIPGGLVPGEERIDQDTFAPLSGGAGHSPSAYMWDGSAWVRSRPYRAYQTLSAIASTVTFSGVPSDLRTLRLKWTARTDSAAVQTTFIYIRVNGDVSTTAYISEYGGAVNAVAQASNLSGVSGGTVGYMIGALATAGVFASGVVDFVGWDSPHSGFLGYTFISQALGSTNASWTTLSGGGRYSPAGPYTSVSMFPDSGNFVAGSEFVLEGW
jgi:hypothetical protein